MILLVYQSSHRHLHRCVATSELPGHLNRFLTEREGPYTNKCGILPIRAPTPRTRPFLPSEIGSSTIIILLSPNNNYPHEFLTKTNQSFGSLSRIIYPTIEGQNARKIHHDHLSKINSVKRQSPSLDRFSRVLFFHLRLLFILRTT